MKKLFSIATILILVLSVFCVSCTQDSEQNPKDNTTESYSAASAEFKKVTGIELPEIDNLEVDREYPYQEGDTGYCFDIIGGSALTYESYLALETFLTGKIGNPDEGYPSGDQATGRASRWTTATRWYTLDWYKLDNDSFMIFLNTDAITE